MSGIEQITNALANQKDIEAVHILSHGSEGSLKLGSDVLNGNDIENFNTQLKQWGNALTENGDILLYGCDAAARDTGKNFVKRLSEITGADIAASDNLTGSAAKGGDWDLEIATGKIEATVPFNPEAMKDYDYTLANFSVTVATDDGTGTVAGTLSKAILDANAAAGDDTITIQTSVRFTGTPNVPINSNIAFIGGGFTVSGDINNNSTNDAGDVRPFLVNSGIVSFSNMTISGGRAQGGNGGTGDSAGGAAAGMGGGLFIYNGTVALNNTAFAGNQAIGGNGGTNALLFSGGGGGGVGGTGGAGSFGGGGVGGTGIFGGTGGAGGGTGGSTGGFGGGGGGSAGGTGGAGGAGGFGGGGGASGLGLGNGGAGGYGGGGGSSRNATVGIGGFGGGNATTFTGSAVSGGGGGAGLGGAIFIRQGSLTLNNATFSGNTATGGTGGNPGKGKGGAVFAMQSINADPVNGSTQGMPSTLPTVSAFGFLRTSGNTAAQNASTTTDNNDIYGTIINTAPVLADTVVTLNSVLEDAVAPTGAVGTLISAIAAIGTNITDPDTGALVGIAITAADTTNGSWFYTIDGGTTWNALGAVSNSNARLLAANTNTRIYFQPTTANYNGTVTNALTFRAWDQVVGTNGATANTSINVGISTATNTAAITVNGINDQPSFTNLGNQTLTAWTNTTQTVNTWVNSVTFGPANEVTQAVKNYTINITSGNTLFTTPPTVANNGTLTYTPNGTPGTATIEVQLQDDGGTTNGGVDLSDKATFNITIPAPKVNLTASTNTASEAGTTSITFTATAEGNVVGAQTVNLGLTGTASSADFTGAIPAQITIPDGQTIGTVTFTVVDDTLIEGNETATLTISNPSTGIALGTNTTQSIAITDNDFPNVNLSVSSNAGTEAGTTAITVTATASQTVTGAQTVNLGVTGTKITAGDYNLSGTTITIPDGQTTGTVTFTVVDDALIEGNETATLAISNPSAGIALGTNTTQSIAITDNDFPNVNLSVSPTTGTEAGTTSITITATTNAPVVGNQTVNLGLTGTATAADFIGTIPTQITIANGTNSGQVTFTINDDQIAEITETANLAISNPSAGIQLGTTTTGSFTITDNDTAGFDILPISGNTSETGSQATFDIRLRSQPTANVTIGLTSNNTAEGTVLPANLTFNSTNWNTLQTVTVTGVDDLVADGNINYQIITAAATSTDPNYNNLNPADVAVTNTDNDTPGVTVTQSGGSTEVTEGGNTDTYTVQLNTLPTSNVQITVTADAQAQISLNGTTFAATQTLTFTNVNGITPQTVTVRAVDDTVVEGAHTSALTHAITNSTDPNYPTTRAIGPVNAQITDNDISYSVVSSTASVIEGNSGTQVVSFTVTRRGEISQSSSIDFNFGGTATNGVDYNNTNVTGTGVTATGSTITFAANATIATIAVSVLGDRIVEPNETLALTLSNATAPGTANIIGSPITTTIQNDDTAGITINPTSGLTTTEAGGTANFTVVLNSQPTADVSIGITSDKTSEGKVDKPSLTFNAANWNTPQTVTVTGVD